MKFLFNLGLVICVDRIAGDLGLSAVDGGARAGCGVRVVDGVDASRSSGGVGDEQSASAHCANGWARHPWS